MAIDAIEYNLLRHLRQVGALPVGQTLLEVGEANWYGDVPLEQIAQDIDEFADPRDRSSLHTDLESLRARERDALSFGVAKIIYKTFLRPATQTAIDLHGTATALRLDLNHPIQLA